VIPLIVVAIGVASTAIMLAVLLALIKSLKALAGSVARFQEDVEPILDGVQQKTDRSQQLLDRISTRQLGSRAGGRIRR
jgi:uncharacterized protein YoxC